MILHVLARRLGRKEVYIAYRRTRDEMPASDQEIAEAEEEGIKIMYLVAPKEIVIENGKVTGITMINQVLGEKDESERRRPEAVADAQFTLLCDTIIAATGQKPELSAIKDIKTDKKGMITNAFNRHYKCNVYLRARCCKCGNERNSTKRG